MNFFLRTAFAVSHRFGIVVFSLFFFSRYLFFYISLLIYLYPIAFFFLVKYCLVSMLSAFSHFFSCDLFLVSLHCGRRMYLRYFLSVLKCVEVSFVPQCSQFLRIFCVHLKIMYILIFSYAVSWKCQ